MTSGMARIKVAIRFVRSSLAIMDGTTAKGMRRIGRARYKETIRKVLLTMPTRIERRARPRQDGKFKHACDVGFEGARKVQSGKLS